MAPDDQKAASSRVLATNRKAFRDYHVLEKLEAGIELRGAEVKSLREGRFSLAEGFALLENSQVFLQGLHIQPYSHARAAEQDPDRRKRLLLHRREIDRILGQASVKGHALIPLSIYFKHGLVKVELGICKGKHAEDKRDALRKKTADREAERAMASRTKRSARS